MVIIKGDTVNTDSEKMMKIKERTNMKSNKVVNSES